MTWRGGAEMKASLQCCQLNVHNLMGSSQSDSRDRPHESSIMRAMVHCWWRLFGHMWKKKTCSWRIFSQSTVIRATGHRTLLSHAHASSSAFLLPTTRLGSDKLSEIRCEKRNGRNRGGNKRKLNYRIVVRVPLSHGTVALCTNDDRIFQSSTTIKLLWQR